MENFFKKLKKVAESIRLEIFQFVKLYFRYTLHIRSIVVQVR